MEDHITAKEFGDMLEHLVETVFDQGHQLQARVEVQDVKMHKLWEAYRAMGISMPLYAKKLIDPIRKKMMESEDEAPYWGKYHLANEELEQLMGGLKKKDNPIEILHKVESVVNDLLILLNFRWEMMTAQLGTVVKRAHASRASELSKVDEFRALEPVLKDPLKQQLAKVSDKLEKMELMEQQFDLFQTEQEILDQMETICDERDRLFSISEELFLR
jgi:hypothetical protein